MRLLLIVFSCILATLAIGLIIAPYAAYKERLLHDYKIEDQKKFKLLVVLNQGIGEREQMARHALAAKNIDIEFRYISNMTLNSKYKYMLGNILQAVATIMTPDLVIVLDKNLEPLANIPTYKVLDTNENHFFTRKGTGWDFRHANIAKYYGFLVSFRNINVVEQACNMRNKKFVGLTWYPTVQKTYYPPPLPNKLFYNGGSGILRNSAKYKQIFAKLAASGYLYLTSDLAFLDLLPNTNSKFAQDFLNNRTWKKNFSTTNELIPFDGVSLLNVHNETGVSLLLHSEGHLPYGTPTGRIFEAAAANSIIISDKNQFIIDHFGDNVLYIDVEQEADEIFAQIDAHMQWIFNNTAEAQAKAQRCYEIFLEKFTLEDQFLRLLDLHQQTTESHV